MDLLQWVRGDGFTIALVILVLGIVWRVLQIIMLGRAQDLSKARNQHVMLAGMRTVATRALPIANASRKTWYVLTLGYFFHIGLLLVIFFFIPHIQFFKGVFGYSWPGLPNGIIDGVSVIAILSLAIVLFHRISDPVQRMLSTIEDYLAWLLTILPLITGYMAFHHMWLPYETMLGVHILTVELLMVAIPFTKLSHMVTLFMARWFNGALAWRKGVRV